MTIHQTILQAFFLNWIFLAEKEHYTFLLQVDKYLKEKGFSFTERRLAFSEMRKDAFFIPDMEKAFNDYSILK